MPAKTAAKTTMVVMTPKVLEESRLIAIEDVCLGEDSGWRRVDPKRVSDLKQRFLDGEYGRNVLRKPSIIQVSGHDKKGMDGRVILCDGKHTFCALKDLHDKYKQEAQPGDVDVEWSPSELDRCV